MILSSLIHWVIRISSLQYLSFDAMTDTFYSISYCSSSSSPVFIIFMLLSHCNYSAILLSHCNYSALYPTLLYLTLPFTLLCPIPYNYLQVLRNYLSPFISSKEDFTRLPGLDLKNNIIRLLVLKNTQYDVFIRKQLRLAIGPHCEISPSSLRLISDFETLLEWYDTE